MKRIKLIIATVMVSVIGFSQAPMDNEIAIAEAIIANCEDKKDNEYSEEILAKYQIFSDNYKVKQYDAALPYWRFVAFNAPGLRETTFQRGITMFKKMAFKAEKGSAERTALSDTVFAQYRVRAACHEDDGDLQMRWAQDMASLRTDKAFIEPTYTKFNKAHEILGDKMSSVVLGNWLLVTIKAHKTAKIIEEDGVWEVYDKIDALCNNNMQADIKKGEYYSALEKCTGYMEKYDYMNAEKMIEMAKKKYEANPTDEANLNKVYKILKNAKATDIPLFLTVAGKLQEISPNCVRAKFLAGKKAKDGDVSGAIAMLMSATELEGCEVADIYYQIAQLHYSKGSYSNARTYATKAAEARPGWGDPYILIGRLYASSGKTCDNDGDGVGFGAQVVTWVAIDMFNKAKNLDPSCAEKAQKLINKYYAYMPEKSDIFLENLNIGSSYYVGCWIQRSTTVRAAN